MPCTGALLFRSRFSPGKLGEAKNNPVFPQGLKIRKSRNSNTAVRNRSPLWVTHWRGSGWGGWQEQSLAPRLRSLPWHGQPLLRGLAKAVCTPACGLSLSRPCSCGLQRPLHRFSSASVRSVVWPLIREHGFVLLGLRLGGFILSPMHGMSGRYSSHPSQAESRQLFGLPSRVLFLK